MPVIIFTDKATSFIPQTKSFFTPAYKTIIEMAGNFKETRSILTTQDEETLYLVFGLGKPERYEIFCLSRKNNQQFMTIYSEEMEIFPSDKNLLKITEFDGDLISKRLVQFRIAPTTANKRSKGVSQKGIGELKDEINKINQLYSKNSNMEIILKECEERIMKMWNFNGNLEEAKECYKKMVEDEMKKL